MTAGQTIISSAADVAAGARWLVAQEPRFAQVIAQIDPLPLRLRPPGFEELLNIIVSQQVSVASANAIRQRMHTLQLTSAKAILSATDEQLKAAGFSRAKIRYARALAGADIDFAALNEMDNDTVMKTLIAVPGIGPWTAQIYLMFCLGRSDAFAPGDLALQEAARVLFDLPDRPTARQLEDMAQNWRPWRSVAARALFAYYRIVKQREGLG